MDSAARHTGSHCHCGKRLGLLRDEQGWFLGCTEHGPTERLVVHDLAGERDVVTEARAILRLLDKDEGVDVHSLERISRRLHPAGRGGLPVRGDNVVLDHGLVIDPTGVATFGPERSRIVPLPLRRSGVGRSVARMVHSFRLRAVKP